MRTGIEFGANFNAVKGQFFDVKKITRAVKRGTQKSLSYFGAYVRKAARWSIKKRKRYSKPGEPPSSHTGVLRNFILYWLDKTQGVVLIGPVLTNRSPYVDLTIPELLEEGGTIIRVHGQGGDVERITYEPRPYMGPAFEKGKEKLPEIWHDSIKP